MANFLLSHNHTGHLEANCHFLIRGLPTIRQFSLQQETSSYCTQPSLSFWSFRYLQSAVNQHNYSQSSRGNSYLFFFNWTPFWKAKILSRVNPILPPLGHSPCLWAKHLRHSVDALHPLVHLSYQMGYWEMTVNLVFITNSSAARVKSTCKSDAPERNQGCVLWVRLVFST